MILTEVKLKKAIQSCKNKIEHHYEYTYHKKSKAIENEHTKIEALKKQLPKKPVVEKDKVMFGIICGNCPVCGSAVYSTANLFCNHCGQALDWSDVQC